MATADPKWRPRCTLCNAFVPMGAHVVYYDDYMGGHEDATECLPGSGCNAKPAAPSTEDGGVTGVQAPAGRSRAARMAAEFNTHPNSLGPAHVRALAATLMGEESQELLVELTGDETDRSKIARELADVTYVAYTIAWSYGIDLDAALREIHRAAMDKIHANVRREGDGKIIKPPGFVPPDMTRAVERGLPSTEDGGAT